MESNNQQLENIEESIIVRRVVLEGSGIYGEVIALCVMSRSFLTSKVTYAFGQMGLDNP